MAFELKMGWKGERLIPPDQEPPRGWQALGEVDTAEGLRLHIIYWRRQKRLDHQILANEDRIISAHRW